MIDMRNLTRLKKLDENAPETMKAFSAFDKEAFKDGAIDVLHKQLMAVAVGQTWLRRSLMTVLLGALEVSGLFW
jgi:Cu/Ag efflux pump CusA